MCCYDNSHVHPLGLMRFTKPEQTNHKTKLTKMKRVNNNKFENLFTFRTLDDIQKRFTFCTFMVFTQTYIKNNLSHQFSIITPLLTTLKYATHKQFTQ